jgi:hypothetical protein
MADCCYAECCYAECCYAECRFAECRYAECHFKSLYPECRYAECRYTECRGAMFYAQKSLITLVLGLPNFQSNQQSNIFLLEKLLIKIFKKSCHKDIFEILSK